MNKSRLFILSLVLILSISMVGIAVAADSKTQSQPPNGGTITPGSGPTISIENPSETSKQAEPQSPPIQPEAGITMVSEYAWSQATGTYTEITGGTQVTTSCDDISYNNYALPFTFTFNNLAFTAISIQCNGFMAMGTSVSSSYTPLSTGSSNNVIAALGGDLETNLTNSEIRYEVLGTSPNQVAVIQWKNFRHYSATGDVYNFQVRLYETTNLVEVVYGPFTPNTTARTQQVGLRGASAADFNNRTSTGDWLTSTAGLTNSATMALTSVYYPPTGLTWDWTPPQPHPAFNTSYKTATNYVLVGEPIAYAIHIINTGTASADAATMVDPIPSGTTYNGDVTCGSGTCSYNAGLNQVEWSGTIPVAGDVTVSFSVGTAALPCGMAVVNQATLNDPGLIAGPVTKSATTMTRSVNPSLFESFDDVTFPPTGWGQTYIVGTYNWDRQIIGSSPTILPHSGAAMARWNSYSIYSGNSTQLYSPVISILAGDELTFYMTHDTGYSSSDDSITPQISTDGGATWSDLAAPILRYDAAYATPGWGKHSFDLSAYVGQTNVRIGLLAYSDYGNNIFVDDVSVAPLWFPCSQVVIGPDQAGSSCAGTSIQYPLNVSNITPVEDTIDVSVTTSVWVTTVEPTSLTLLPGETGSVIVTVTVPDAAVPPDEDTATIQAVGLISGLSDTATVNTTVTPPEGMVDNWTNAANGSEPSLYWGHSYYFDGEICAVGGLTGPTGNIVISSAHSCYNIATSTWSSRPSIPTPVFAGAYGLIGDKFYIAGGFYDLNFNATAILQIYDLTANTWSTASSLPSARGGAGSGVVNGILYSAGGAPTGSFPLDCPTYGYDPLTDTWSTLASCPLQGGYGFDLGGSVGSDVLGRLFVGGHFNPFSGWFAYDPIADSWETLANLPGGITKTPLFVDNPTTGQIYMIGGLVSWTPTNTTYEYDYTANTWTLLPGTVLNTSQGGSTGPAHGSFGDPILQGFWTLGGTAGSGSLAPAPFEFWEYSTTLCAAPEPDITVTPGSLSSTLLPDQQETQQLQICNIGDAPLEWTITEVPPLQSDFRPSSLGRSIFPQDVDAVSSKVGSKSAVSPTKSTSGLSHFLPAAPIHPEAVLWDQTTSYSQGGVADNFPPEAWGAFSADDFQNTSPWSIETIYMPGWMLSGSMYNATALHWCLYPDVGGIPGGQPFTGGEYWCWSTVPTDPAVTIGGTYGGDVTLDVVAGTGGPLIVPPGTWWLVFYPDFPSSTTEFYYWFFGTSTNLSNAQLIDPMDAFGMGWTSWTPWAQAGVTFWDLAFRLEGTVLGSFDIPWLSENPTVGVIPPGNCTDVDVTFDSTGLSAGQYFGGLDVGSNDPDQPTVNVPATLEVLNLEPVLDVTPTSLTATQAPDTVTTQQLNVCNIGGGTLDWNLLEIPGVRLSTPVTVPTSQAVDKTLGLVPASHTPPAGITVPVGNPLALLDDFNRADGPLGPNWTVHDGSCSIINNAASCTNFGRATFNNPPGDGNFAEADVAVVGTDLQYTGLLLDYGAGNTNLLLKIQQQNSDGMFEYAACYLDNGGGSFGLGFFPLSSPFHTAHMAAVRVGDSVTLQFTNIDSGGQPDQTYVCDGAPAAEGTGIGITGYSGIALLDNFGGPGTSGIPWLDETPISGSLGTGQCQTVDVSFDSTGLTNGDYFGTLEFGGNVPPFDVPVTLTVVSAPNIYVDPTSLSQTLFPDQSQAQVLNVCNSGDSPLTWNLAETPPPSRIQSTLWNNGPLVTFPAACGGVDASRLQTDLGMNTLGFGHQYSVGYRMADDFTITDPGGWNINQITFYAYQTGAPVSPSPITAVYYQIWNGPPNDPNSSVVFGDLVTNRLVSSSNPNMERDSGTSPCANNRFIFADVASAGVVLPPGTYWLDWMSDGNSAYSGPWAPPVTILGQTTTGNGLQYTGAWASALDTGTSTQQDLPFIIDGEVMGAYDIPWLSENPVSGTVQPGTCSPVDVTFDSTGLNPGMYAGALDVTSNDPDTPSLIVPVSLEVIAGVPDIVVDPLSFDATLLPNQTTTLPMTIFNQGDADLTWSLHDGAQVMPWSENFDAYATGSQMHGQGGWKGWGNLPGAGALTSDAESISTPNSVAILGASDLVHEYSGYTSGTWTYTAWQFVPTDFADQTYFILLNTYSDEGSDDNWSTQVFFDGTAGTVVNEGTNPGTLPLIKGQWVEIKVVIDLDADHQAFYYNGGLLYEGSWGSEWLPGGGAMNIGAVDLYANSSSVVYYDDISISHLEDTPWLTENPTSGTTAPAGSSPVDVTFNSTGMVPGVYATTLFVESNDPDTPTLALPVTMTIVAPEADLSIVKSASVPELKVGETLTYTLEVTNNGPQAATSVIVVDTLPSLVEFVSASAGCSFDAGVVTCDVGTLSVGQTISLTIVVTALSEGTATNTAEVSSEVADPNMENNTSTVDTTITPAFLYFYLPFIHK